ncbi:MAG TPA: histidine phosphatase family protein, partial [Candidatus Egerieimonas faecigallinarum]|nr:histidine phosphatase family protein [Candidatus Egerieimonas faecigallinarum]
EEYQDKTILIAMHGCSTRAFLRSVYEDKNDFWHRNVPPNCAVNILDVQNGKAKFVAEDVVYYDRTKIKNFYDMKEKK